MAAPTTDDSGFFGTVGKLFTKAKDAVVDTVSPLASEKPTPTLPGAAPEGAGRTLTGGRRHRKTRKGKRSTRKSTRRHRKSRKGGVVDDEEEDLETALLHSKSELKPIPDYLRHAGYTRRHRKGKKGGRKY